MSSWALLHLQEGFHSLQAPWLCPKPETFSPVLRSETPRRDLQSMGWVCFTAVLSHLLPLLTQLCLPSRGLAATVVWLGMVLEARMGAGNHVRFRCLLWSQATQRSTPGLPLAACFSCLQEAHAVASAKPNHNPSCLQLLGKHCPFVWAWHPSSHRIKSDCAVLKRHLGTSLLSLWPLLSGPVGQEVKLCSAHLPFLSSRLTWSPSTSSARCWEVPQQMPCALSWR